MPATNTMNIESSKIQSDTDALKTIRDLASEEIMSLSDSEIRACAKGQLVDIDNNASTIRSVLLKRCLSY